MVISGLRPANCSLKSVDLTLSDIEVVARGLPKRVRVPFVGVGRNLVDARRVVYFDTGAPSGR